MSCVAVVELMELACGEQTGALVLEELEGIPALCQAQPLAPIRFLGRISLISCQFPSWVVVSIGCETLTPSVHFRFFML